MRPSTNVPWAWTRKEKQNTGAASDVSVWDPAADKAVYLHAIVFSTDADCNFQITEGNDAAGTRIVDAYQPDGGTAAPFVLTFPFEAPYKLAADAIVRVTTSAGNSKVVLYGFEA
jgi:hypothetical protein